MKNQPSRILVYGLLNPIREELFYVGQTRKRREFRLLEHIEKAVGGSSLPVHAYIRDVIHSGRIPSIFVLERVGDPSLANEAEIRLIKNFGDADYKSLPLHVKPQTPKSTDVTIRSVKLTNIQHMPTVSKRSNTIQTPAESGRRGVLTPAPHTTGHTDP